MHRPQVSEIIDQNRRALLGSVTMGIAIAGTAGLFPLHRAMAEPNNVIRPFRVDIPNEALADLRQRVAATRLPGRETVNDGSQGLQLVAFSELMRYWATGYDWRKAEARLNALPQFTTTIDGIDIHFIHVRSRHANALPLIMTHGWPGSVFELLKTVGPLTDPTSHGGRAEDAFDLVLPSIPGFGFSGKPKGTGWGPERIARAWAELMNRLGYRRYVAQGGDWGAPISSEWHDRLLQDCSAFTSTCRRLYRPRSQRCSPPERLLRRISRLGNVQRSTHSRSSTRGTGPMPQ
jgi:hypothetical protein